MLLFLDSQGQTLGGAVSLIVESFAGGWFSKANFTGRLTPQATQSFTDYALKKMRDELRARRADDA